MNRGNLVIAVAVGGVALIGGSGPAAAAAPSIDHLPAGVRSTVHEDVCGFRVREDVRSGPGVVQTFVDADGTPRTIHGAGSFTGTFTHIRSDGTDGASVRINFSGPGSFNLDTGELTARGPWALASPDDPTTPQFDGFLLLVRGQATVTANPVTKVLTVTDVRGSVTDICAVIA